MYCSISSLLPGLLLAKDVVAVLYSDYILAPSSRTLIPQTVYQSFGSVVGPQSLCDGSESTTVFDGTSSVTYDFGKNIAGIVTLKIEPPSSVNTRLGLTFSESSLWISNLSSDATADLGLDATLWFNLSSDQDTYRSVPAQGRGGFRYLSIVSNETDKVVVRSVSVNFTAAPTQDLRSYTGFFHCNDELVNRIWYAGAYTTQLATIDPRYGNSLDVLVTWPPAVPSMYTDWFSNFTITNGTTALTDGGKRDRLVWAGDMSIALETAIVSTYDLPSIRNSLEALFVLQTADGRFPYASRPFPDRESFTYHLHTLINAGNYYRYSGDVVWLAKYWPMIRLGVAWALGSVDDSGLAFVSANASSDWLRAGNVGANAMLYFVLQQGVHLAVVMRDRPSIATWTSRAKALKLAAKILLWDEAIGMFRDNETATVHPQGGNAWAVKANLTFSASQRERISSALQARWGPYGAPAPEAGPSTISPFIGGFELQAHYLAGRDHAALELIRRQWGFMLQDPRMTNSTFIEGYSTDGTLHYALYSNDARVSHSHAWSSGPTSALIFFTAGIQVSDGGASWMIAPQPGDLAMVDAGFSTSLGSFLVFFKRASDGSYTHFEIKAPKGSLGEVHIPSETGILVSSSGQHARLVNGVASGLHGGKWSLLCK
ncbi:Alpha-L-rhamnosidase [Penicillium ucsense]|uniref:Alpha-L-rhamnosidase n=1 Tax=Penicillium ucsense TaxID=2839758 RepID=A0A8J8VZ29_9EURO|nr:Alpha-L-rhamnosidase [Penicillium ucsense]KAF7731325.1 Alpha-L-rhamnosidase [Penicillium ucsense]